MESKSINKPVDLDMLLQPLVAVQKFELGQRHDVVRLDLEQQLQQASQGDVADVSEDLTDFSEVDIFNVLAQILLFPTSVT